MKSAIVAPSRPGHRPGARVGMIELDVEALGEAQSKEAARRIERRLDQPVELQIGLDLALIEVELGLAPLLGEIAPVPGRNFEIAALRRRRSPASASCSLRALKTPGVQTDSSRSSAARGVFAIVSARR